MRKRPLPDLRLWLCSGPRQCGKTTLARMICEHQSSTYFDLESQTDLRRLVNPEIILASLTGLVVIDEIQTKPDLFATLRVVVDKPGNRCNFLILGSASPQLIRNVSETLAAVLSLLIWQALI